MTLDFIIEEFKELMDLCKPNDKCLYNITIRSPS